MADKFYSGRVHTVVYEDPAQAFYIVKVVLDGTGAGSEPLFPWLDALREPVTAKGHIPGINVQIGTWFGFEAHEVTSEKYGNQLQISRAPVIQGGWDDDQVEKMLTSNGVGYQVARSIRLFHGDKFQEVLGDAVRLTEVPGVTPFGAETIVQRWKAVQAHYQTLDFLGNLGIPSSKVREVWQTFGDDAKDVLTKNPWALVQVDGITFTDADNVARKLGLPDTDPNRIKGAVLSASNAGSFGHLYMRTGMIYDTVAANIFDVEKKAVAEALAALYAEGQLILDKTTRPGTMAVYEPWCYEIEAESAARLRARMQTAAWAEDERTQKYVVAFRSVGPKCVLLARPMESPSAWTNLQNREQYVWQVAEQAVAEWGEQAHLGLSPDQIQGVINALAAPISILTGLPGTGKTTSLQAAVRILQDMEVPFLLVAPTGIAAKNLAARTGATASTIHRAFSAKGMNDDDRATAYVGVQGSRKTGVTTTVDGEWGFNQEHTHSAEVIIIDEASMVDQHLLFRLLDCTSPTCRLVFVGDYAQLPSVGPGNVLRDLIESQQFPTIKLTQIFRQTDTSGIVYAAHAIHRGDVPDTGKDFRFLTLRTEEEVLAAVLRIGQRYSADSIDFQILSPRHSGTVGVTNLNARLRELLNPQRPGMVEVRLGDDVIREGDRIMIIKNEYRLGVFNGDVGRVATIDMMKKVIEVEIFGPIPLHIPIQFKVAPKLLRLAYACTVHKAQGLEYKRVVMPLVTGFAHQLQRNLLYTAITRAKEQVVLVGHLEALRMAVINDREDTRLTLFLDRVVGPPPTP